MKNDMIIDGINLVKYGITKRGSFVNGTPTGWHIDCQENILVGKESNLNIDDEAKVYIGPFLSPTLTTELRESISPENFKKMKKQKSDFTGACMGNNEYSLEA